MQRSKSENFIDIINKSNSPKPLLNLVLDLDNTIINTYILEESKDKDLIENLKSKQDKRLLKIYQLNNYYYFIYERPYLNYFIMYISKYFNVYTYTNGLKCYHDVVTNALVERYPMLIINSSMYKINYEETNIKNLDKLFILTRYQQSIPIHTNTIIIDDREDVWPFDLRNLLKIDPFTNSDDCIDDELLYFVDILELVKNEYNKKINKNLSVQVLLNKIKSEFNI